MTNIEQENAREHIASFVLEGYILGFDLNWELSLSDFSHSELSEITISHISKQIIDGFTNGEIQEDNKQSWWYLKLQE